MTGPGGRAGELIGLLELRPHPEGGFYREVHRTDASVTPGDGRPARSSMTTIYYLLAGGQHSRWHAVASDELWQWLEGAPVELFTAPPTLAEVVRSVIGGVAPAVRPTAVVPPGWWQAARTRGEYSLVGCTVAPGFDFADFGFLRSDPGRVDRLRILSPELAAMA